MFSDFEEPAPQNVSHNVPEADKRSPVLIQRRPGQASINRTFRFNHASHLPEPFHFAICFLRVAYARSFLIVLVVSAMRHQLGFSDNLVIS